MRRLHLAIALGVSLVWFCQPSSAATPTDQINSQIAAKWKADSVTPAGRCSDETFVRRIYLDLAGRVPSNDERNTFLANPSEQRREELVDALLHSENYAQHFADLFDAILMGRAQERVYEQRARHGWRGYLESAFRDNRPWADVAREVLLARPDDPDSDGAVWFLYERKENYQAIAEAVAPAFFGIRIECAQCHDHMMADEIEQAHYWGLVAFFNRSKNQKTDNGLRMSESAVGGFSEFANLEGSSTPNYLTFFDSRTVHEKRPKAGESQEDSESLYSPADVSGDPREPLFSRRTKFVTQILEGHPLVPRAMVNRVWAILMGRGIVHPHDEIDSMHDPSHPKLLDWLADDFATHQFDVRRLVRSIVLSDAYQLDSRRPSEAISPDTFTWYIERPLTAEQLARSIQQTLRGSFDNNADVVKGLRQQIVDVLPDGVEVPVADALYFSNNAGLDQFIRDSFRDGSPISQIAAESEPQQQASRLIETLLGRQPTSEELDAIVGYLDQRRERAEEAIAQVAWSLITSAEFRFNH
ncbi:DUF1549 domain-containing protein [Rhodopirellula sp. MGV]|uniref:DUF1549 domain-containing protein n=1 Tax=Rhodopirellula sp. MGV TaxID=2023130 RepID=UPI000B96A752|nr:DUF1549 domain-containing protein [Rhodopirellula sp. MGV]OYP38508.1 hypothetical protein CGZ80_01790 [Rhodopirellula sp. MGV]PNY33518.1 DUF1549 domain-containing protein [Rhodopirellula baltica]